MMIELVVDAKFPDAGNWGIPDFLGKIHRGVLFILGN